MATFSDDAYVELTAFNFEQLRTWVQYLARYDVYLRPVVQEREEDSVDILNSLHEQSILREDLLLSNNLKSVIVQLLVNWNPLSEPTKEVLVYIQLCEEWNVLLWLKKVEDETLSIYAPPRKVLELLNKHRTRFKQQDLRILLSSLLSGCGWLTERELQLLREISRDLLHDASTALYAHRILSQNFPKEAIRAFPQLVSYAMQDPTFPLEYGIENLFRDISVDRMLESSLWESFLADDSLKGYPQAYLDLRDYLIHFCKGKADELTPTGDACFVLICRLALDETAEMVGTYLTRHEQVEEENLAQRVEVWVKAATLERSENSYRNLFEVIMSQSDLLAENAIKRLRRCHVNLDGDIVMDFSPVEGYTDNSIYISPRTRWGMFCTRIEPSRELLRLRSALVHQRRQTRNTKDVWDSIFAELQKSRGSYTGNDGWSK